MGFWTIYCLACTIEVSLHPNMVTWLTNVYTDRKKLAWCKPGTGSNAWYQTRSYSWMVIPQQLWYIFIGNLTHPHINTHRKWRKSAVFLKMCTYPKLSSPELVISLWKTVGFSRCYSQFGEMLSLLQRKVSEKMGDGNGNIPSIWSLLLIKLRNGTVFSPFNCQFWGDFWLPWLISGSICLPPSSKNCRSRNTLAHSNKANMFDLLSARNGTKRIPKVS